MLGTVYPHTIKAVFVAPETNKHKSRVKWTKLNILKQIAIQRLAYEQALHSGDVASLAQIGELAWKLFILNRFAGSENRGRDPAFMFPLTSTQILTDPASRVVVKSCIP